MDQNRSPDLFRAVKSFNKVFHVVTVNGAVIVKAQVIEHRRRLTVQQEPEEVLDRKDQLDDSASDKAELLQERFRRLLR